MKSLLVPFCAWFAATVVSAQPASQIITARSYSGQFVARELQKRSPWGAAPAPAPVRVPIAGEMAFLLKGPPVSPTAQSDEIVLEPSTLIETCERLKGLFLMELGLRDEWRGSVDLIIRSSLPEAQRPSLTATYRADGWSYTLELPKTMQERMLVRAVIQTLLAELANRQAGSQSAEIPYWLVEGLSAHLQAYNPPTFVVRPNVQSAPYEDVKITGLDGVRAGLRQQSPLTFEQLSWPEPSDVAGQKEAVYRSCAQLFFDSLLHLDDGPSCLRQMLQELPKHLNWQTSFLLAFHSHFARLLDVEKWWDLNCVSFNDLNLTVPRTEQECWHKLQEALDVPVEVHLDPSRMPAAARMTLQEVIMQWNAPEALPALQRTVHDLEGLQLFAFRCDLNLDDPRAAPVAERNAQNAEALHRHSGRELNSLVARYLTVLLGYVKQSQYDGRFPASLLFKKETVRQLNSLDQERAALRAKISSVNPQTPARMPGEAILKGAKPAS